MDTPHEERSTLERSLSTIPQGGVGCGGCLLAVIITVLLCGSLLNTGLFETGGVIMLSVIASLPAQLVTWLLSRKQSVRARWVVSFLASGVVVGAVCGFVMWEKSPHTMFRRCVVDPIPSSIRIHHFYDEEFIDTVTYFHFTLLPVDFPVILLSDTFHSSEKNVDVGLPALEWWDRNQYKQPEWTFYMCVRKPDGYKQYGKYMWVSPEENEVFFALITY